MEHKFVEHDNCNKENCPVCDGGLSICEICDGAEGSLTTDCCGRKLTSDELDRIYESEDMDFRDGKWREGIRTAYLIKTLDSRIKNEEKYLEMLIQGKEDEDTIKRQKGKVKYLKELKR